MADPSSNKFDSSSEPKEEGGGGSKLEGESENEIRRWRPTPFPRVNFLFGLIIGGAVGAPLVLIPPQSVIDRIIDIGMDLVVGCLIVGAILVVFTLFRDRISRKLFGVTGSAEQIVHRTFQSMRDYHEGDQDAALKSAESVARELVAFWSWTRFYRAAFGTIISVLVAFGGVAGTILLFRQNEILEKQNVFFESQTETQALQTDSLIAQNQMIKDEGERQKARSVEAKAQAELRMKQDREAHERSLLASQLGALIGTLSTGDLYYDPSADAPPGAPVELQEKKRVAPEHVYRIQSVLWTFTPHHERSLGKTVRLFSPEKGKIFNALQGIDFPLNAIDAWKGENGLDFSYARISGDGAGFLHLRDINFDHADLRSLDFSFASLEDVSFKEAFLPEANKFNGASFERCDFSGVFVPSETWLSELAEEWYSHNDENDHQTKVCVQFDFRKWIIAKKDPDLLMWMIEKDAEYEEFSKLRSWIDSDDYDPSWPEALLKFSKRSRHYKLPEIAPFAPIYADREVHRSPMLGEVLEWSAYVSSSAPGVLKRIGVFEGAALGGRCEFSGDASGVNFNNAIIWMLDFSGADLSKASFRGATLPPAKAFRRASMRGVDLEDAIVEGPKWLDEIQELDDSPKEFAADEWRIEKFDGFLDLNGSEDSFLPAYRLTRR